MPFSASEIKGSTDGPGSKIDLAAMVSEFSFIGEDAVAMGFDLYAAGALPAFALDTLSVARLVPELHIKIIESVIRGCLALGCHLVGGEIAQKPNKYRYP